MNRFACLPLAALFLAGTASAHVPETAALVAKKAAILELLHQKARKALVTAAQDSAYSRYFAVHADGHAADDAHHLKERIDKISLTVQSRFQVEEMCLINTEGAEVSRIVGDRIAHDLATDEADAVFFAPGFATEARAVHISPAYLSPDADKWVVAYVTPVVTEGEKRAILHYEHGLEVYQHALNKGMEGEGAEIVAVDANGWIVSDSRRPVAVGKLGDAEEPEAYFEKFSWHGHDLQQVKQALAGGAPAGQGWWETGDGGRVAMAYREVGDWTLLAFHGP